MSDLITKEEFKVYAQMHNIDISHINEDNVSTIVEIGINKLSSLTGLNILESTEKEILANPTFTKGHYLVSKYPISKIENIIVDNKNISHDDYYTDDDLGVIYFTNIPSGEKVEIEYTSKVSDSFFKNRIKGLLFDFIFDQMNTDITSRASSIKEGDVSVNIDTSTNMPTSIQERIDDIKKDFIRVNIL